MDKPRLRLVNGEYVPVHVERLPKPMNSEPWKLGSGPRVWTTERVAELAAANEALRRARK